MPNLGGPPVARRACPMLWCMLRIAATSAGGPARDAVRKKGPRLEAIAKRLLAGLEPAGHPVVAGLAPARGLARPHSPPSTGADRRRLARRHGRNSPQVGPALSAGPYGRSPHPVGPCRVDADRPDAQLVRHRALSERKLPFGIRLPRRALAGG